MTERPILFSGPMIRAILAGTKTQTRRELRGFCPPSTPAYDSKSGRLAWLNRDGDDITVGVRCPYGQPGDRLWVREAFRILDCWDRDSPAKVGDLCLDAGYPRPWAPTHYEADGYRDNWQSVGTIPGVPTPGKLRPGIHMPRWASRITLEITAVRVERLQDISEADTVAEGIPAGEVSPPDAGRFAYRLLWDDINGPRSWPANPWVWVVQFRRVAP